AHLSHHADYFTFSCHSSPYTTPQPQISKLTCKDLLYIYDLSQDQIFLKTSMVILYYKYAHGYWSTATHSFFQYYPSVAVLSSSLKLGFSLSMGFRNYYQIIEPKIVTC